VRIGIRVPTGGPGSAFIRAVAIAGERLGYDSLWCAAHVAIPVSAGADHDLAALGRPTFSHRSGFADPFVALAFMAGVTSRVRLGTVVVPLMASHPLLLAKQAASLDVVSEGRCELGVGAGWLAEEARALGHPVDRPNGRLREAIEIMRAAWQDGTFSYHGGFYELPPLGMYPRPPQGGALPVWIGGKGPTAERLADELGAGVVLSRVTPGEVAERKTRYPGVPIGLTQVLAGEPADWLRTALAFRDAGTDLFIGVWPTATLEPDLAAFADHVLPRLA
jgi:probable F420-dependent oxidoreductase